jgi:ring-1,2-phenylacetyl-CoA epoxidase subunit PaaE
MRSPEAPARRPSPRAPASLLARVLPRPLAAQVEQSRRDARMVFGALWGERAPALVNRPPRPPGTDAPVAVHGLAPRPLRVTRVVRETPDAVSLYLEDPTGAALAFAPGQFLTVHVDVGGETLRRAYSLASPALPDAAPHVTVKRIADGRASNFINDRMEAGATLRVLGPSGAFTVTPDPAAERHLVMLAGGSGITPIMSIAHTVLALEPRSRVTLIYGNRSERDVIFLERIEDLVAEHGARLRVDHVLAEPSEGWAGGTGLLDAPTVTARLDAIGVADDDRTEYFVCGPTPMMEAVHDALDARGVPAERIREERFVRPEERKGPARVAEAPQPVHIRLRGAARPVIARPGHTLLEAGLAAGLDMPFSCAMGGCGACRVKLVDGEVDMEEPNCLTADEYAQGYVLACVSRPCGPVTVEVEERPRARPAGVGAL